MANKEFFSIGELWITKGIRAGKRKQLAKMLKFFLAVPAAKVTNRYVVSTNLKVGAFTVANPGPGDSLPHNITFTVTQVDVADTPGTITITGTDVEGKIISEDIIPAVGSGATLKAFLTVASIVGAGWVQGGTGPDTIIIGFGDLIGMPDYIAAAGDILFNALGTTINDAPTLTVDSAVLAKNTITAVGNGTLKLRVLYQV